MRSRMKMRMRMEKGMGMRMKMRMEKGMGAQPETRRGPGEEGAPGPLGARRLRAGTGAELTPNRAPGAAAPRCARLLPAQVGSAPLHDSLCDSFVATRGYRERAAVASGVATRELPEGGKDEPALRPVPALVLQSGGEDRRSRWGLRDGKYFTNFPPCSPNGQVGFPRLQPASEPGNKNETCKHLVELCWKRVCRSVPPPRWR